MAHAVGPVAWRRLAQALCKHSGAALSCPGIPLKKDRRRSFSCDFLLAEPIGISGAVDAGPQCATASLILHAIRTAERRYRYVVHVCFPRLLMSAVNNTASPALSHSAPSSTEILTHGEHLVQFYETDSALVRTVSTFVAEGLSNGDACFVFATQAHCDAVNADLCARGSDPLKVGEGRYLTADAEETFRRISVDGVLSAELFRNY